jgi:transglutaminase-like putative cysteine protease
MEDHAARPGDHHRRDRSFLEGVGMSGLIPWILGRLNGRELLKFALLAAVAGTVVMGISPLIFRSDASLFLSAALIGLSIGWITARIPLPAAAAGLADGALAMDYCFFAIGRLDVPLRGLIGSCIGWLVHSLPQNAGAPFDAGPLGADLSRLVAGPVSVTARFRDWAVSVLRGENLFDPVASVFFWSLVLALIGAFAGWTLAARRKPLAAVIPELLLLSVVFSTAGGDWHYAVLTVGLVFVLVLVAEHSQKEQDWERGDMGYLTGARTDAAISAGPLLVLLLAAAYILPSISVEDIQRWIREQYTVQVGSGSSAGQSFGLNRIGPGGADSSQSDVFPDSHLLGRAPHLTHEVALVIVTGESPRYLPGVDAPVAPHHYWRAMTYDIYTGSGWMTSSTTEQERQAGEKLYEILPDGILLHQTVTVARSGYGAIYYAGELTAVYRPYRVESRTNFDILGVLVPGADYEADSVFREPDEAALRSAGTDYPDWIRSRYLQLPKDLPQRVHTLARDLTATAPTPYDRAVAIQEYLRSNMEYSLDVTEPPTREDAVNFFLFGSRKGFCDYYATAMAVLARSAGIPSRIAFGYATGIFDPAGGKYTVLQSDTHAWPELYFPGIGWVEFEPTSTMAEIPRPSQAPANDRPVLPEQEKELSPAVVRWLLPFLRRSAMPALWALLLIPILLMIWNLLTPVRYRWIAPSRLMRSIYHGLRSHGTRQGIRLTPGTTPFEFTALLGRENPACAAALGRMAEVYSRQLYSGREITPQDRKEVIRMWPALDRGLWWNWCNGRVRGLRNAASKIRGRIRLR